MAKTATVKVELGKCVVSGCPNGARGTLRHGGLSFAFEVCGVHRKPVAMLLNKAAEPLHAARGLATVEVIEGLDALGDHSAEASLYLAS